MSFLLDIVIPKDEMNKVGLEEQLIEWGGAKFSQEPPKYIGNKELVFEELTNLKYHCGLLGNELDAEKYISYLIKNIRVHLGDFDWYAKNAIKPTLTNADPHLAEGPLYCTCGCNAIINRFNDCAPFLLSAIKGPSQLTPSTNALFPSKPDRTLRAVSKAFSISS